MDDRRRRRRELAIAAGGALMLVLLALQLAAVDHQRRIARSQERSVQALLDKTRAAERGAQPLLADIRDAAPQVLRAGRTAADTLAAAGPLVEGLVAADAPGAVRRGDALAVRALELLEQLEREGAVPALTRLDLLPRMVALLESARDIQRRSLAVQTESLEVQRRTLAAFQRSLAIQEQTLVHVRSLDRRTGGTLGGP